jgi:hypothetical protein
MWVEYWELLLLFLIACMCSLYLVWNALPICSTYFCRQSNHFIWQTCFRYIFPFVIVVSLCFVLFFVFWMHIDSKSETKESDLCIARGCCNIVSIRK